MIPWMKIQIRYTTAIAWVLTALFAMGIMVSVALFVFMYFPERLLPAKLIFITACEVVFLGVLIVYIHMENSKIRFIKKGKAYAANVVIDKKEYNSKFKHRPAHYITVRGLYKGDIPSSKEFIVSLWIYKRVEPGDKALVLRYDMEDDTRPRIHTWNFVPADDYRQVAE